MNRSVLLLLLLLTVFVSGCGAAGAVQVQPPTLDGWVAAHNRGDLDAFVGEYADDVVLLPPTGVVESGLEAVRAAFAGSVASQGVRLQRTRAWHDGALAVELGTWEHFTRQDRETTSRGTYTVVWRRDDGGAWRIVENGWAVAASAGEDS